ncbi:MAG: hypothetical protein JSS02_01340 [Planctomycetes bacterium]|nr:hypothetical protein [Planctomycetota bacterium]
MSKPDSRTAEAREKPAASGIVDPEIDPAQLVYREGDWFRDVTSESGVQFANRNGREGGRYFLIESFGGGIALIDYDLDGALDLFCTGGGTISAADPVQISGRPCPLYRNQGPFLFQEVTTDC